MVVPDRGLRRKAYSAHYDYGMDATQIHRELLPAYSLCTVERLLREFKLSFSWEPIGRQKKGRTKLSPRGLAALGTMLQEDPTLYLKQLKTRLRSEYGVRVSQSTICRAINTPVHRGGLGMSLKTLEHRAMQRNQVDRLAWTERLNLGDFDHSNVLVIDECSVGKNAARRRRGYGDVGHRVRWYDYFGKRSNGTLMAACNCDGFVLPACEFIKETMDSDRFIQYVEEALVPVLGNYVRGERNSIVVMDNVGQHHHDQIRELIEGAGALLLFLPRYR